MLKLYRFIFSFVYLYNEKRKGKQDAKFFGVSFTLMTLLIHLLFMLIVLKRVFEAFDVFYNITFNVKSSVSAQLIFSILGITVLFGAYKMLSYNRAEKIVEEFRKKRIFTIPFILFFIALILLPLFGLIFFSTN